MTTTWDRPLRVLVDTFRGKTPYTNDRDLMRNLKRELKQQIKQIQNELIRNEERGRSPRKDAAGMALLDLLLLVYRGIGSEAAWQGRSPRRAKKTSRHSH